MCEERRANRHAHEPERERRGAAVGRIAELGQEPGESGRDQQRAAAVARPPRPEREAGGGEREARGELEDRVSDRIARERAVRRPACDGDGDHSERDRERAEAEPGEPALVEPPSGGRHRRIVPQSDRGFTPIFRPPARGSALLKRTGVRRSVTCMPVASRRLRSILLAAVALPVALTAGGCSGGSSQTKAGVGESRQLTLRMQSPDSVDPDATYFVMQVKARTHGRIRIVIDGDTYTSSYPDNEVRLVRDLRRGKVSLAYVPSRAWVRDGLPAFQALQAPFLITDYALLRRITTGPIARTMLASLDDAGLVGLGLVPRSCGGRSAVSPLASPQAFRGARIRVPTSPTSELALRALGAIPRTNFSSQAALDAMTAHRLDGVESDAHAIYDNGYVHVAPYLPSNLTLFAKTETLVITRDAFDGLSAADREALRAAAAATVAHANPAAVERSEIALLCDQGLRLVRASRVDLAALHREALRVYATLGRDPSTAPRDRRDPAARRQRERAGGARAVPACQAGVVLGRGAVPSGHLRDDDHEGGPAPAARDARLHDRLPEPVQGHASRRPLADERSGSERGALHRRRRRGHLRLRGAARHARDA